jgi:hypothetical protein
MFKFKNVFIILFVLSSFTFAKKIETVEEYQTYVRNTIDKKKPSLRKKCVKGKKFSGRMTLIWKLNEQGDSVEFTRGKDTVDNLDLYHCYEKEISKIKFQKPPTNEVVSVQYEFFF